MHWNTWFHGLGWVRPIQRPLFFFFLICHWRGAGSHGACCHATAGPTHHRRDFTWEKLTWQTVAARPIRCDDRCFGVRVSEAETCWFSRWQPLLINVSIHTYVSWGLSKKSGDIWRQRRRGEYAFLEAGAVRRQDTWLVPEMDTAATRWRTAVNNCAPPLKKKTPTLSCGFLSQHSGDIYTFCCSGAFEASTAPVVAQVSVHASCYWPLFSRESRLGFAPLSSRLIQPVSLWRGVSWFHWLYLRLVCKKLSHQRGYIKSRFFSRGAWGIWDSDDEQEKSRKLKISFGVFLTNYRAGV